MKDKKKYQWDASDYEKHSKVQQLWAKELITRLNPAKTDDVLDLGCGDGKITAEIAGQLAEGSILGIDSSESMIALAEKKYPSSVHANLRFELMNVTALTFEDQFDCVFSNAALHWVKDHRPVLEGIYSSLRSTGRMMLQMGGKGNAGQLVSVIDHMIDGGKWGRYFTDFEFPYGFFEPGEYSQLLEKAGFVVKRAELIPKDMMHDGINGLKGWIRTTWLPYIECIPSEEKESFIHEIAERYLLKNPLDSEGKVHLAMMRLEVEAVKK